MSSARSRDTQKPQRDSKSNFSEESSKKFYKKKSGKIDSRSSIEVDNMRPYSRESVSSLGPQARSIEDHHIASSQPLLEYDNERD